MHFNRRLDRDHDGIACEEALLISRSGRRRRSRPLRVQIA
jgi:excalibur calcium-binding domain-containing protein